MADSETEWGGCMWATSKTIGVACFIKIGRLNKGLIKYSYFTYTYFRDYYTSIVKMCIN